MSTKEQENLFFAKLNKVEESAKVVTDTCLTLTHYVLVYANLEHSCALFSLWVDDLFHSFRQTFRRNLITTTLEMWKLQQ
jgi:hypothetical protein